MPMTQVWLSAFLSLGAFFAPLQEPVEVELSEFQAAIFRTTDLLNSGGSFPEVMAGYKKAQEIAANTAQGDDVQATKLWWAK